MHGDSVASKRWNDLDPRVRRLILISGVAEGALKVVALIDLKRRSPTEVQGPKVGWAAAITLINSVGAVPLLYFRYGRRRVQRPAS